MTKKKYKSFLVQREQPDYGDEISQIGFPSMTRVVSGLFDLPSPIDEMTREPGLYRIRRVAKSTPGAIGVAVSPFSGGVVVAVYDGIGTGICRELAKLLGYSARKPETIYVTIKKVKGRK